MFDPTFDSAAIFRQCEALVYVVDAQVHTQSDSHSLFLQLYYYYLLILLTKPFKFCVSFFCCQNNWSVVLERAAFSVLDKVQQQTAVDFFFFVFLSDTCMSLVQDDYVEALTKLHATLKLAYRVSRMLHLFVCCWWWCLVVLVVCITLDLSFFFVDRFTQ